MHLLNRLLLMALLLLAASGLAWGQQVIGSFPNMDGGFENQSVGALTVVGSISTAQTAWTTQSSSSAGASIVATGGRSGPKYGNGFMSGTSHRRTFQSPTTTSGPTATYTIQFYYRGDLDGTIPGAADMIRGGIGSNGSATSIYGSYVQSPNTGANWTKYVGSATTTGTGLFLGYVSINNTAQFDVDDYVIYAGSVDNTAPDPPTSPNISGITTSTMTVNWSAPGSGVDGGGYMVVRGTADPTTNPNVNGIYAIGNTIAAGEQVVYIGTSTSYLNTALTPSTQYYFRIYTVDKAFNYSSAAIVNGTTSTPSLASEPTIQASNLQVDLGVNVLDLSWTNGNGSNRIVVAKLGGAVDGPPVDGVTYTANAVFGSGSQIGTGNYVVYSGTGNSVSVSASTAGTYHFAIYEFNGSGGTENYLTSSPATNSLLFRKTIFSLTTGNWSTASTWVGSAVPTSADNVIVENGHTVTLTGGSPVFNATVNAGGQLISNATLPTSSIRYLQVYGTSVTNDGIIGNSGDNLSSIAMEFFNNVTLQGSGTTKFSRFRPGANASNVSLTFDKDATVTYTGSSGSGGASIYTDNNTNDDITITVNTGKTVTLVDFAYFNTASSTSTNGTANTTININGTVNMSGANSNMALLIAPGKTCALTVNGTLNIGRNLSATSAGTGATPTINVGASGSLTVAGIADFTGSAVVTGSGTFTLSSGATINIGADAGLDPTNGPIRTTTRNFNSGANYSFVGSATAQSTGSDLPATINNLTISNPAGVTLTAATTVNGAATVNSGALLSTGGFTFTNNGTCTVNGTFRIDQGGWATGNAFTYGANGTLAFNNSSGSYGVNADVFWPSTNGPANVNVQGAGGITMNVARTVGGIFQTSAGVTNANNLTLNDTVQINSGGFFSGSPTYGSASTLKYNTGGTFGRGDEWNSTNPANIRISNNTTLNYPNGSTAGRTITGSVLIDAGSSLYMDFGGPGLNNPLTVGGNFTMNGNFSLGDAIGGDLNVGGNWTKGAGTFNTNSRNVQFNGSSAQSITGVTTFSYLEINNSAGVMLNNNIDVDNQLKFSSGNLVAGSNNVYMGVSATIVNAAAGKCVVTNGTGRLYRNIAPGGSFQFAVGPTTTTYNPVTINLNPLDSGSELFNVRVLGSVLPSAPDNTLCVQRAWDISESTPGSNSAALTFQWTAADEGSNFARALSSTFHYSTAQSRYFDVAFNTPATGTDPYSVSTVGGYPATEFSIYIVGQSGGLPVQLASFTGMVTSGNRVRLDWRTISELNNYGFYVQRRLAGAGSWGDVSNSFIPGHGTTSVPQQYTFTDNTPLISATEYRLKQVDLDGTENFSEPITVDNPTSVVEIAPKQFALLQNYPNPFNPSTEIKFSVAETGSARLVLYNAIGQEVASLFNEVAEAGRYYKVALNGQNFSSGMYFYRLTSGKQTDLKKLMLIK